MKILPIGLQWIHKQFRLERTLFIQVFPLKYSFVNRAPKYIHHLQFTFSGIRANTPDCQQHRTLPPQLSQIQRICDSWGG